MSARPKHVSVEETPVAPPPAAAKTIGWLPDCVLVGDKFETGLAFFADGAGRITRFSREPADLALAKRLPGQAALPGLVNTHAQSWQRVLRGRFELRARNDRETLGNWQEAHDRALGRMTADDLYDAARMAFVEMLLSGITCVGEAFFFHRGPDGQPWPEPLLGARAVLRAAHDVGIRISLLSGAWLREGFGQPAGSGPARCVMPTAEEFVRESEQLREHIEKNLPGDEAWIGVAVRSLAGVPLAELKIIAAHAHAKRLRLHLHLGESAAEHAGCVAECGRSPVALLAEHGLLDKRFVAIHGTHLAADDVRALGAARVAVCACPAGAIERRAGVVPADRLLASGATIALGSDGAGAVNLLAGARLIDFQLRGGAGAREDPAKELWIAATSSGARALGATGGALEVGRPADFFTVNLFDPALVGAQPEHLLGAIVFAGVERAVREVWVGARQRVGQWRHPAQSAIVSRFAELQTRLWAG